MPTPSGLIMIWSGAIVDIPPGWVLCDGNNGTPDLRDRFLVGAGSTYAVGASGGNLTHTHSFTSDGHTHSLPAGADIQYGAGFNYISSPETVTGNTDATNHLPPYYSLAFVMKI